VSQGPEGPEEPEEPEEPEPSPPAPTSTLPLILLVDDDETFRERLARALRARTYQVVTACNHETAMQAARASAPAFAIVDLKMPGASGLELVRDLHALSPATRIVVLTGYGSIASAVDALHRGAHDYLSKPADADEIIAALLGQKAALGHASARAGAEPPPSLARAEWEHMTRILADCGGNVSEAARRLGITRRTLQLKLKKDPPRH
jgi:two-component system response regulator RegA